jgi:phosphate transport system protein
MLKVSRPMTPIETRSTLDQEIRALQDEVLRMGGMVGEAVLKSVDALKSRDFEASREVIAGDLSINQKHVSIEEKCIEIISTQQPVARDARLLAAILQMGTELERIGDYAKGIGRINLMIGEKPVLKPLIDIPRMAQVAVDMLNRALEGFVAGDIEQARQIPREDDMMDALYNQVYRELITFMISDPSTIDRANYLLWVAHNLERMADRVVNICEGTLYTITGEYIELDASDDEFRSG